MKHAVGVFKGRYTPPAESFLLCMRAKIRCQS